MSEKLSLSELILLAKGDRTYREYATDSGVSSASINRIVNGAYLPSSKALQKLTSPQAKPRNDVTYEDMMIAAGYQKDYSFIRRINAYANALNSNFYDKKSILYKGLIQKTLIEGDIDFSEADVNDYPSLDFKTYINRDSIREWGFSFQFHDQNSANNILWLFQHTIGSLALIPPNKELKLSIVTNNDAFYNHAIRYEGKIAFKGDLSIILIDLENYKLLSESYLSDYDTKNPRRFYLI